MVEAPTAVQCPACGTEPSRDRWSAGLCPACLIELALGETSLEAELDRGEAPTLELAPGESFSEGEIHGKRYRVRSLLGRGGMGEVWRAYDLKLRLDVALKALHADLVTDSQALEMLRQEVRVAREVVSSNVCRVFDLEELDGQELISMEYVDGTTLLEIVKDRGPLDLNEAREIASQFLAGLEAIHQAGLVHRDIKPENLMLTRTGRVVVMDFGIAKGLGDGKSGMVAGTPAYMSPEQLEGGELDGRADLFSAGVVLAEMVEPAGIRTFEDRRRVWEGLHRESLQVSETPWATVIARAVAADRKARFATASALARALEEVTLRAAGDETARPYPGLSAFQEEDAKYFYGRELEVEALWKKLRRPHLLAVIGPSGAGKSSFLRAGLLPTLTDGWQAVVATPGNRPFASLARALAEQLPADSDTMEALLRFEEPEVAVGLISQWREGHLHGLIIVDQFEELFTQNPDEIQQSFADLLAILPLKADVHVLVAMRDDFLVQCSELDSLAPVFSELSPLKSLSGASLRRAIVQPALKCGYRFEDESIVEEMLAEVEGERGALPMVAFAAAQLWEKRDRDQGLLTREAYEEIGGVGGALAQHAEATLEQIGQDRTPVVREVFRNLVTAQGTRAARDRNELLSVFGGDAASVSDGGEEPAPSRAPTGSAPTADRTTAEAVLNALVDARLLTSYETPSTDDRETPYHRIEIIHESLLASWPRLVRWRTQDAEGAQLRDELRHQARIWQEKGRPDDLLWTGTSYKEFELWRERYPGGLTAAEEEFCRAMTAKAERRRRQRRFVIAAVMAVLLGVAATVTTLWRDSERARRQAVVAEEQARSEARRAEASKLVAIGRLALEDDPTAALAWATASLELADTPTARRFALEALWRGPTAFVLDETFAWKSLFSPNGAWLAAGGQSGYLSLWSRGGARRRLEGQRGNAAPIGFSADSTRLVSSGRRVAGHETLRLWSLDDAGALHTWPVEGVSEWNTFFDATAQRAVTVEATPTWDAIRWRAWPLAGGEPTVLEPGEPLALWRSVCDDPGRGRLAFGGYEGGLFVTEFSEPSLSSARSIRPSIQVTACAFDHSGNLAASTTDGTTTVLPLDSPAGGPVRRFENRGGARVRAMDFSPDGTRLALGTDAQVVRLLSLSGPPDAEPWELRRGTTALFIDVTFDPSGNWLATAESGATALWSVAAARPILLRGHTSSVSSLVFSRDSQWIVSASFDGSIRRWPMSPLVATAMEPLWNGKTGVETLALDPDDTRFLFSTHAGGPLLATVGDDQPVFLEGLGFSFWALALDPTGRWAAAGGGGTKPEDALIRLWDLEGEEPRWNQAEGLFVLSSSRTLDADDGQAIHDLVFTPTGDIASAGTAGLRYWSLDAGTFESFFDEPMARLVGSADGGALVARLGAAVLGSGPVLRFDAATGDARRLASHGDVVTDVALDARGEILVTGDENGVLRVGAADGAEPHMLLGHAGRIAAVAISPDGRWIASGGNDNTVRLWPMPDLSRPPLHTLTRDDLLYTLQALTNVRAVREPRDARGWRLEVGPFPGWEEVPVW